MLRSFLLSNFIIGALLLAGCATSSRISTEPLGAKVYVNGDYLGETPLVYNDTYSLPKRLHVQIRKEGYKELDLYVDKTLSYWSLLVTPYTAGVGVLWAYKLEDEYRFDLSSLKK